MIRRLLIANRGEIAVRIARACREAGIAPLAVYSEADRGALHVACAEAACCIGPASPTESYLKIDAILAAAQRMGADAVHPGYGFLSERAEFAEAVTAAGLIWVGPPAEVIRALGDKITAKRLMAAAGVPVAPGYADEDQSEARLEAEAVRIGVPLLIKAAAGGGGRGMRVVTDLSRFVSQLDEARREAHAAFGDTRVLLETYVARPRHIEFQIVGDTHGHLIHLGERECSLQRRHQKIVEESPSALLTPELRARMAEAALIVGHSAGYVNAGTVEFLVDPHADGDHRFYFLEVNTRLQVEHPVTEQVTGLDLVRLQLRVAQGEPLPLTQAQVTLQGHSIEVRLYAEDPAAGHLPSVGRLSHWIAPEGPGVRVDRGVECGSDVTPYYDALLAKLIVTAENRASAVDRMTAALRQTAVLGVRTNLAYLLSILQDKAFRAGDLSTRFLEERFALWRPEAAIPDEVLVALAAEAVTRPGPTSQAHIPSPASGPWQNKNGWRNA